MIRGWTAALALLFGGGAARAQCTADAGPASYTICQGSTQQFNGSGSMGTPPYQYSWSPIAGLSDPLIANPVCSATSTTIYTLTVTDANLVVCTDQVTVNVDPAPPALLTSTGPEQITTFNGLTTFSICDPSGSWNFSFADQSTAVAGSTTTLNWGDGSPVVAPAQGWSLNHVYNQGLWTMTYTVTYPNGCVRTAQYQVFLGTNPGGGISTDPNTNICTGGTLPFYINSVAANSPGTTYIIDFGDGQSVTLAHPPPAFVDHTYTTSTCGMAGGQLNVLFTAQNPCDQTQGQIGPIRVSETPQAQFTLSPNDTTCVNSTVTFTDQSIGLTAPGCATAPRNIWSISPAAGWVIASGTLGNDNGNPANPGLWTDGSTALGIQFTVAGLYTVTDLTGNSCGIHQLDRTVCVEEPPVPVFALVPAMGCAPFSPVNTNSTAGVNSCLLTYEWTVNGVASACGNGPAWNFSSGGVASFEPQFTFTEPGTYTVQFRARNSCNVPPVSQVITVNSPPQAIMNPLANICAGQCVNPSAVVQTCGDPGTTYNWNFPGGTPANSVAASPGAVCFNAPGNPTISLMVTNACGNTTVNENIAISALPPQPVIASNSPVCAGQTLSLSAALIPGASFSWTDPQGTFISNQPSVTIPNVMAANAGIYTVVAVANGCSGPPATVNVQVIPAPAVTVSPPSAAICNGQSTTLTANGAGNYQWFIGATQIGTGAAITTSPAVTTTYTVSGNVGGCPGSTTVTVTVYPLPATNAGPDVVVCDQAIPVNLNGQAAPQPGTWSGPNVTPGGIFTPVPGQLGVVTLNYSHTNANGCTRVDQVDVTVQSVPVFADAGPDVTMCQGNTPVQLLGWSPPGGTWVGAAAGGMFTPSTIGNFNVTYNYGSGTCATSDQVAVSVIAATILNVSPDFAQCADGAPTVLVASAPGGTWTGNGISGPPWEFDPAAAGSGSHPLTYTYVSPNGCVSTAQTNATVHALPVVNAGPDVQLCNQPIPYQITGATPAGGTWSAGSMIVTTDGWLTPNGVGSDIFTYSFTDANGCSGSDQITVDVTPVTNPAFAGNDTSVCIASGPLQLLGAPIGGSWSGTQVDAAGAFDTAIPGSYVLTYSFGTSTCLLQDMITVVVNDLPLIDAGSDLAVCLDASVLALGPTPGGGTWSGAGVDAMTGAFDPQLAGIGMHPLTYQYTDPATGCANSDVLVITVDQVPVADLAHDPVACVNSPFVFTNNSIGATTSEWHFGDAGTSMATDPTHSYLAGGSYMVMLVAGNAAGCTDTIYSSVDVWDVPIAAVALSADTGCGPFQVDFTNNSVGNGIVYDWDFGGLGNSVAPAPPPFVFPADPLDAATYTITLTATNYCGSDQATSDVVVIPPPTAVIATNVNVHCSYADVPIVNASHGMPDTFEWDFGDGTTSNSADPIVLHPYVANAVNTPFTITLVASNACGSDTAHYTITVLPNQVVAFFNTDPVMGCSPLTVDLTQYTTGDTAWYWDLGDGNSSLAHDLTHTYTVPGTYTISLSAFGCGFDTYTTDVTVLPSPVAGFTTAPAAVCVGGSITFSNTSTGISGAQWDFGDGTGSSLTSPQHSYAAAGVFPVTLSVTSAVNGCVSSITHSVVVNTTPVAAFTPSPMAGCINLNAAFTNTSQNGAYYQWDFGDGNSSGIFEPFHTYTTAGLYTVTLVAENVNGCTDTTTALVAAHPLPNAAFTLSASSSCSAPVTVQTINASQGAVSYAWDLGNGQASVLNQPTITFDAAGTYAVQLTATNQFGCTDNHQQSFTVFPPPVASFTANPVPACAGRPVVFTNTSVNSAAYRWRFGDGTGSQADGPLHSYAQPGTYSITLIAFGAGGCIDTLVVPDAIAVHPTPLADFESDTLASVRNAIQFSNLSQGAVSYEWDFNDGTSSTQDHPLHLFPADGGGFTVCLISENAFSCPDTVCKFVLVNSDPMIFVPNTFTPNGDGRNETFRPILNGFEGWNYRFIVFDRWGMEIFDTDEREEAWDGRVNGKGPVIDVYVWKVVVERDGDAHDFIGHVTLLD